MLLCFQAKGSVGLCVCGKMTTWLCQRNAAKGRTWRNRIASRNTATQTALLSECYLIHTAFVSWVVSGWLIRATWELTTDDMCSLVFIGNYGFLQTMVDRFLSFFCFFSFYIQMSLIILLAWTKSTVFSRFWQQPTVSHSVLPPVAASGVGEHCRLGSVSLSPAPCLAAFGIGEHCRLGSVEECVPGSGVRSLRDSLPWGKSWGIFCFKSSVRHACDELPMGKNWAYRPSKENSLSFNFQKIKVLVCWDGTQRWFTQEVELIDRRLS